MFSLFPLTDRIVEIRNLSLNLNDWIRLRLHLESTLLFEEVLNTEDSVVIIYEYGKVSNQSQLLRLISKFEYNGLEKIIKPRKVRVKVKYSEKDTDLSVLSDLLGLSISNIIELHMSGTYQLVMYGFVPGFAYLKGVIESLRIPRKSTPSYLIKSGAVAIAENYTGIYPLDFQGGWYVLGYTDFRFLGDNPLLPGDIVEFLPI
jgi:KipI family sensor histidine kinase inhibitor